MSDMIRVLEAMAAEARIPLPWLYRLYLILAAALRRGAPWWVRDAPAYQAAAQAVAAIEEPLLAYLSHLEEPDPPPQHHRDAERDERAFELEKRRT